MVGAVGPGHPLPEASLPPDVAAGWQAVLASLHPSEARVIAARDWFLACLRCSDGMLAALVADASAAAARGDAIRVAGAAQLAVALGECGGSVGDGARSRAREIAWSLAWVLQGGEAWVRGVAEGVGRRASALGWSCPELWAGLGWGGAEERRPERGAAAERQDGSRLGEVARPNDPRGHASGGGAARGPDEGRGVPPRATLHDHDRDSAAAHRPAAPQLLSLDALPPGAVLIVPGHDLGNANVASHSQRREDAWRGRETDEARGLERAAGSRDPREGSPGDSRRLFPAPAARPVPPPECDDSRFPAGLLASLASEQMAYEEPYAPLSPRAVEAAIELDRDEAEAEKRRNAERRAREERRRERERREEARWEAEKERLELEPGGRIADAATNSARPAPTAGDDAARRARRSRKSRWGVDDDASEDDATAAAAASGPGLAPLRGDAGRGRVPDRSAPVRSRSASPLSPATPEDTLLQSRFEAFIAEIAAHKPGMEAADFHPTLTSRRRELAPHLPVGGARGAGAGAGADGAMPRGGARRGLGWSGEGGRRGDGPVRGRSRRSSGASRRPPIEPSSESLASSCEQDRDLRREETQPLRSPRAAVDAARGAREVDANAAPPGQGTGAADAAPTGDLDGAASAFRSQRSHFYHEMIRHSSHKRRGGAR